MSPEALKPKETKKKEKNIINIYTTDRIAIENLRNGDGKDIPQIDIVTGIVAQGRLQASLEAGGEPQWLIQVTLKKSKDQTLNELKKGEIWAEKGAWEYYRKKERRKKIGKEIKENCLFDYFFPVSKNLQEIIEKEQSRIENDYYPPRYYLKDKMDKLKEMYKELTLKCHIKLEIINIVEAN